MRQFASFVAVLLLTVPATLADIAPDPLFTGGATASPKLEPQQPCPVTMVAEEVDLYPSPTTNTVTASFILKNTGNADAEFEVGFPSYFKLPLRDFKVEIDGVEQKAELKETGEGKLFISWMCWNMKFAKGQERKVIVKYAVDTGREYEHLQFRDMPADLKDKLRPCRSGYVLRTGAGWEGNIGKAVIRIHYSDACRKELMIAMAPAEGWVYDAKAQTDTLTLNDFEPVVKGPDPIKGSPDISYGFRQVDVPTECSLLTDALKQKRLQPWAMKHLLEMVEKENPQKLSELSDQQKAATVQEILEWTLPPQGPNRYETVINEGAENILKQYYERLLKIYTDEGQIAKAKALSDNYVQLSTWIKTSRDDAKAKKAATR